MKVLHCSDAGFECPGVIKANSIDEVLQQAGAHALEVHGVQVTPELAQQIKGLIRDENN